MKKSIIVILALVWVVALWAEKRIVFDQLTKPSNFYIKNNHLYIIEFPHIHVYSLTGYKLIKTFGKEGEGPGYFLEYARLHFHPDYIIVQSRTRFSYFTKDWQFIKEKKIPITFDRGVKLFGKHLVASHNVPAKDDPKATDLTVNIYDAGLKKIKEVYRQKYFFQLGKEMNALYLPEMDRRMGLRFFVCHNKIFVEGEDGETGNIYVYDNKGEKIYTIRHEFEKMKVTGEHKKAVEDFYKLRRRRLYDILKARGLVYYPKFFPAVHYLKLADNKIYIIPYKKKDGKSQLFIFDLKGKLLKQVFIPIVEESIFSYYPGTIQGGKFYQLVENQSEQWELHIHDIE